MNLDFSTLITGMVIMNVIFIIIILYYLFFNNIKNRIMFYFLAHKVFETTALIQFGQIQPDSNIYLSLLPNTTNYLSIFFLLLSIVSFEGRIKKIPAILNGLLMLSALITYILVIQNERLQGIFSSIFIGINYALGAYFLFRDRKYYKMPILIGIMFIINTLVLLTRAVDISQLTSYTFSISYIWDAAIYLSGLISNIVCTFGFLLLIHEVYDSNLFKEKLINQITLEQSPVSILITDVSGNIQYVNSKFCEITGFIPEEVLGENPKILKSGLTSDETFRDLWKTLSSGKIWQGELINRKKNDDIYYENAVIAPIKDNNQNIVNYLAIKLDITKQIKAEETIQKKNKELINLNQFKDQIFSIIAHDLKNPVGNIKVLVEMLIKGMKSKTDDNIQTTLSMLKKTSDHAFYLVDNLLGWSRNQLGTIVVNPENFEAGHLVEKILKMLGYSIEEKNLNIKICFDKSHAVFADVIMIETALRNLISNAIKFTPNNGEISIDIREINSETVISVKDTGIGMNEDQQKKLFEFGKQISTPGTNGEKGTGLGLILSHEFVKKNNGRLWVKSAPNQGSEFYLALPKPGRN